MAPVELLIRQGREELAAMTDTPRLDAEVLLGHILKRDRLWLLSHGSDEVSDQEERRFLQSIQRRKEREPVAYIVGQREFYGRMFSVDDRVLIPRPETELLVERSIEHFRELSKERYRMLDLGTGSGCLAITIALEAKALGWEVEAIAADISEDALAVARENSARLQVGEVISFMKSDWFSDIPSGKFDLIVSNPPYVARSSELSKEVLSEPVLALFAEEDGLADIQALLKSAKNFLSDDGIMLIECGLGQWKSLQETNTFSEFKTSVLSDLQGIERVIEISHVSAL